MKDVKQNKLKEEKILNLLNKESEFQWELSIFDEIGSTNDYLLSNSKEDKIALCLSESQTKGRGRNSKQWQSPKYENIYMSLSFSTKHNLNFYSSFSLVAAISVHKALIKHQIESEIKWPNDIYINSKKVGGILIETINKNTTNIVVVGIGLNVFMKNNLEIDREWTSLALENEKMTFDRNEIIPDIANELIINKKTFEEKGFGFFKNKFNNLNFLKNKSIKLSNQENENAVALEVNDDGSLNVRMQNKITKIVSGEVSIKIN